MVNIRKAISGLVKKVLSRLPLAEYASVEGCKKQLLAVFKTDRTPNEFLISHAVEDRMKEVKWISL